MKWFVFWDLKTLHLTVNIGDGHWKAGQGNKAETIMPNNKMRRKSEFVRTGSNSGYIKNPFLLHVMVVIFFLVEHLSIFFLLNIHVCCFMAKKTLFFSLLRFPLLNWSQFITKKTNKKKTPNMNYFFCEGLLCQQESARWLEGRAWWEAVVKENKRGRRRRSQSRTSRNKELNRANMFTIFPPAKQ